MQNSASIQPRTSLSKFANNSISQKLDEKKKKEKRKKFAFVQRIPALPIPQLVVSIFSPIRIFLCFLGSPSSAAPVKKKKVRMKVRNNIGLQRQRGPAGPGPAAGPGGPHRELAEAGGSHHRPRHGPAVHDAHEGGARRPRRGLS